MLPFFLCVFSPHVGLALELFCFFDIETWRKESEEMMDSAYVKLFLHQFRAKGQTPKAGVRQ
jgi:hypothetical protein